MGFVRGPLVSAVLTDTHAHLDFPEFDGQLDAVIARARDAGVHRIITVGIDRESCRRSLATLPAMVWTQVVNFAVGW